MNSAESAADSFCRRIVAVGSVLPTGTQVPLAPKAFFGPDLQPVSLLYHGTGSSVQNQGASVGTNERLLVTMTRSTFVPTSRPRNVSVCEPALSEKDRGFRVRGTPVPFRPLTRVHCQIGAHTPSAVS